MSARRYPVTQAQYANRSLELAIKVLSDAGFAIVEIAELERLREAYATALRYRETMEGLPEGTLGNYPTDPERD